MAEGWIPMRDRDGALDWVAIIANLYALTLTLGVAAAIFWFVAPHLNALARCL